MDIPIFFDTKNPFPWESSTHYFQYERHGNAKSCPSLPNEVLWQIVEYMNVEVDIDKSTLMNLRLTSQIFNFISSSILFRDLQFHVGGSLEDLCSRSFSMRHAPFSDNINGLIISPSAILPDGYNRTTEDSIESAKQRKRMPMNFYNASDSISLLTSAIGPQIQKLNLRFHNKHCQEELAVLHFYSFFLSQLLYTASDDLTKLEQVSISIPVSDGKYLPFILGGPPTFTNRKRNWTVYDYPSGLLDDSVEYLDDFVCFDSWVQRESETICIRKIQRLDISVFEPKMKRSLEEERIRLSPAEHEGLEDGNGILNFLNFCNRLISFRLRGAGTLFDFLAWTPGYTYNGNYRWTLTHLSLSDINFDISTLDDSKFLLCLARTLTSLALQNIGVSRSEVPRFYPRLPRGPIRKWSWFMNILHTKAWQLTDLRLKNLQYVDYNPESRVFTPYFHDEEDMTVNIGTDGYERPIFTPFEEDVEEFFALRDVLVSRRQERGLPEDKWLRFCLEHEEESGRLVVEEDAS